MENDFQRESYIALFEMFMSCKDYEAFYYTASWAYYYVNQPMFVYAFQTAFYHLEFLKGFGLPAAYEIYPEYFTPATTIYEAQAFKNSHYDGKKPGNFFFPYSYDKKYFSENEYKMAYYTQDVGLNAYFYYYNMDYPVYMDSKKYGLNKDRQGETYFYTYQQLWARFYLEKFSTEGFTFEKNSFSWKYPVETGYQSFIDYESGKTFPTRESNYTFYNAENSYFVERMENLENRYYDLIDSGYFTFPNGKKVNFRHPEAIDFFGSMIQGNFDVKKLDGFYYYYPMLSAAFKIFYNDMEDKFPLALGFSGTAMRDTFFYDFYERTIIDFFWQFKKYLTPYTNKQLSFDGVKISDVKFDKLMTYFENFDYDITNSIENPEIETTNFYARTERLNFNPFAYQMSVYSEKAYKAAVRVYMGPKYTVGMDFNSIRKYFVEFDYFTYNLKSGNNFVKRNSHEFAGYSSDRQTFHGMFEDLKHGNFSYESAANRCGFPEHLMLPKGSVQGTEYTFYFYVSEYETPTNFEYNYKNQCQVGFGNRYMDNMPFGFPFDRDFEYKFTENYFENFGNFYFKDVPVFFKNGKNYEY